MTAANQFQALFQSVPLAASVKRYAMGRPTPHADIYRRGEKIIAPIGGQTVGWKEERFSRDLARITGPTSPTKAGKKPKQTPKSATLIDVKEHVDLPAEWLYLIQNPHLVGDVAVDNAKAQFASAAENLAGRIANTVEYVATKANEGSVDLSAVPNSELSHTIDYPVKTLAASIDWDETATSLIRSTEIPRIRDEYLKAAGFDALLAYATKTIDGYIVTNAELKQFLAEGSLAARVLESSFMEGGAKPNLGGLLWRFTNAHYATDAAPDTAVDYQTANTIVVLPPESMWSQAFTMGEGHELVPVGPSFVAGQNPASVQQLLTPMQGFWSYVELQLNPVVIRLHAGYKFLPIQKIPNAVMAFNAKVS